VPHSQALASRERGAQGVRLALPCRGHPPSPPRAPLGLVHLSVHVLPILQAQAPHQRRRKWGPLKKVSLGRTHGSWPGPSVHPTATLSAERGGRGGGRAAWLVLPRTVPWLMRGAVSNVTQSCAVSTAKGKKPDTTLHEISCFCHTEPCAHVEPVTPADAQRRDVYRRWHLRVTWPGGIGWLRTGRGLPRDEWDASAWCGDV
jgi:hypothetical protein